MAMQLLSDAVRHRESTKKVSPFGKAWEVGDQLKCFYPVVRTEDGRIGIASTDVWGHPVTDFEGFGLQAAFIPTTCEINDRGEVVGEEDITYKFSRIAAAYTIGQKQAEINKAKAKFTDPDMLQNKLRDIDKKYDRSNLEGIKPVIGALRNVITTEVVAIKCESGAPVKGAIPQVYTRTISDRHANMLQQLLNDPRYAPTEDQNYLEVEYTFTSTTGKKAQAGQADPQGVSVECKLCNTHPDIFKSVEGAISTMATDAEVMENRNLSFRRMPQTKIANCIRMYTITNSEALDTLPEDTEETFLKSAKRIRDLKIPMNAELQAKVDEALGELQESEPEPEPEVEAAAAEASPFDAGSIPTMESLAASVQLSDVDYTRMDDIDLSAPLA